MYIINGMEPIIETENRSYSPENTTKRKNKVSQTANKRLIPLAID